MALLKAKSFLLLLGFGILLNATCLLAQVHEATSIMDLKKYLSSETLVLLDLDNTLIEPSQQVGGDQWFTHLLRLIKLDASSPEEAEIRSLDVWMNIQTRIQIHLVEKETASFIRELQASGIPVLGLTARNLILKDITLKQLESVGISFKNNSLLKSDLFLPKLQFGFQNDVLVRDGIIFAGIFSASAPNGKGQVLAEILKAIDYTPKQILFLDDKMKNVQNLEDYFSSHSQVVFHGFRLSALDQKINAYGELFSGLEKLEDFLRFTNSQLETSK